MTETLHVILHDPETRDVFNLPEQQKPNEIQ